MILLFTVVQGHSYGQQANVDVTFRWVPDRTVVRVLLPGSFNGWSDQSSAQMTFNSTQGQWHHTYSLTQGMSYEYKIRPFTSETENVWLVDPLNDTQSNANDPNSNSVVSVTDPMIFQMARHQNGSGAITAVSAGIFSSKTLTKLTTQVNGPEFDALPYYSNGVFYYSLAAPIWCDLGFKITAEYSDGTTITESLGMDAFPSVAVVDEARPSGIEDGVNYNSTAA
ncbi:MAG: hypothetical protein OXF06_11060, partial [Bacteroidetes bacterium]|nr:hypothetical protein [Bacteroidota bacterium]